MKPQRSALKIEPLQCGIFLRLRIVQINYSASEEKENQVQTQSTQSSQFKAKEKMDQMQSYFKRSIAVIRRSEEFTGTEAADILTAYIESHRSEFTQENVGRSNAVKVRKTYNFTNKKTFLQLLEIWRQQKIIHCVDSSQKRFADSERVFYRLGEEEDQCLYIASSPVPSEVYDDTISISRSSSTRRNNSFKRLFSPLVRRNRSNSRGRDKDNAKDGTSTLLKSTWSLFSSSDKQEKKARKAEQQMIKEEEAEMYELALFHLLGLIEVEFLEDVALPVQDAKVSLK